MLLVPGPVGSGSARTQHALAPIPRQTTTAATFTAFTQMSPAAWPLDAAITRPSPRAASRAPPPSRGSIQTSRGRPRTSRSALPRDRVLSSSCRSPDVRERREAAAPACHALSHATGPGGRTSGAGGPISRLRPQRPQDRVSRDGPSRFLRASQQHECRHGARIDAERPQHRRVPEVHHAQAGRREHARRAHHRQPGLEREDGREVHVRAHEPQQQRQLERLEAPAPEERERRRPRCAWCTADARHLTVRRHGVVPARRQPAPESPRGDAREERVKPRERRAAPRNTCADRRRERRATPAAEAGTSHGRAGARRVPRQRCLSAAKPASAPTGDVRRVGAHHEPLARDGGDDAVAHGHAAPLLEEERGRGVRRDEPGRKRRVKRLAREADRQRLRHRDADARDRGAARPCPTRRGPFRWRTARARSGRTGRPS